MRGRRGQFLCGRACLIIIIIIIIIISILIVIVLLVIVIVIIIIVIVIEIVIVIMIIIIIRIPGHALHEKGLQRPGKALTPNSYHKIQVFSDPTLGKS